MRFPGNLEGLLEEMMNPVDDIICGNHAWCWWQIFPSIGCTISLFVPVNAGMSWYPAEGHVLLESCLFDSLYEWMI